MVTLVRVDSETDGAFRAIADPTRRAILDLIRQREYNAGDIAARFPASRPAIAKHMGILREAGLLRERRDGTMRFYSLEPRALERVDAWLSPYRLFWAARHTALTPLAESQPIAEGSSVVHPGAVTAKEVRL